MEKILFNEWPRDYELRFPADLILCMEGLLDTPEEVGECLYKCAKIQGGTGLQTSSNSNIQMILNWYIDYIYEDTFTPIYRYADKIRKLRAGPDLKVSKILKKEIPE